MNNNIKKADDNIFKDIKLPNPIVLEHKTKLTQSILKYMKDNKLTKARAANLLNLSQKSIEHLQQGRLNNFRLKELIAICRVIQIRRNFGK